MCVWFFKCVLNKIVFLCPLPIKKYLQFIHRILAVMTIWWNDRYSDVVVLNISLVDNLFSASYESGTSTQVLVAVLLH